MFYVGYHVVFEVFGGGRTIGKRAAGLRVVSDGGAPVGLRASLIRNFMRLLEGLALLYVPAMISVLVDAQQPAPRRPGGRARSWCATPSAASVVAPSAPFVAAGALRELGRHRHRRGGGRAPCARSSSAAPICGPGARRALAAQLAGQLRPLVAGARPGLDDETFLEHLAAAKARGKMRESAEDGH